MARRFTVFGRVETEDKSSATVEKIQGKFTGLTNFLNVKFIAGVAAAGAAVAGLAKAFTSSIRATISEEKALNRLNVALRSAGTFSEAAAKASQAQAAALEEATGTSSRLVLEMEALARTFVQTNEDARNLTKIALDFASGAGISFEEAVRRLGRGVQGAAGDIANFAPEIRDLTKAELAAGEATRILGERFAGQAVASAKTLEGRMNKLRQAMENLQVEFGTAFLESAGAAGKADTLTKALKDQEQVANAVGGGLGLLTKAFFYAASGTLNFVDKVIDTTLPMNALHLEIAEGERAARRMAEQVRILAEAQEVAAREAGVFAGEIEAQNEQIDLQAVLVARLNKQDAEAEKILKSLGVTLDSEVSAGMAKVKAETEALGIAFQNSGIGQREYDEGLAALQLKLVELEGGTGALAVGTDELGTGFSNAADEAGGLNRELGDLAVAASNSEAAIGDGFGRASDQARELRVEVANLRSGFDQLGAGGASLAGVLGQISEMLSRLLGQRGGLGGSGGGFVGGQWESSFSRQRRAASGFGYGAPQSSANWRDPGRVRSFDIHLGIEENQQGGGL